MVAKKATSDVDPFGPPADAPPPKIDSAALVARLTQLQKDAQAADTERARAEAQLAEAKKALEEIDAHLTAMKVDPATAAEALDTLEREIATLSTQLAERLQEERGSYQQIQAASA